MSSEEWNKQVAATPYLNSNGLENGRIPAGKPCPFLTECGLRMDRCPSPEALKENPFSCAAARLHSMIKKEPSQATPFTKGFLAGKEG